MTSQDPLEQAQDLYEAGKAAFERGLYRQSVDCLVEAVGLAGRNSALGGEIQIWLVNAYQAAGQSAEAIALCQQLDRHPHLTTRKQSRRLLFILQAPQLKTRSDWLTEIPDLTAIETSDKYSQGASKFAATPKPRPRRPPPPSIPEPIDLSQVDTKENSFVAIALTAIVLTLAGLLWRSQ